MALNGQEAEKESLQEESVSEEAAKKSVAKKAKKGNVAGEETLAALQELDAAELYKAVPEAARLPLVATIIENMTVLELAEFVKDLEKRFGVTAAAPVSLLQAAAPAAAAPVEEKTQFDVVLAAVGEKKIQVIKEVRVITALGLKEAKELVEGAPKPVKQGISKDEAEAIKKQLTDVGATVEIQ